MSDEPLPLTAQHLARLGLYHGWQPDEVADFIAVRLGFMPLDEAARVAEEAHRERQSLEDAERDRLDEEARQAEHDLKRRRSRDPVLVRTPAKLIRGCKPSSWLAARDIASRNTWSCCVRLRAIIAMYGSA